MFGWNLYLQIVLSTGSDRLPESWFITFVSSFVFKFETASFKEVINTLASF